MSSPIAKAERSRAKDARQMPAPETLRQRSTTHKRKKRPWLIEARYIGDGSGYPLAFVWRRRRGWWKWGRYRDRETAERTMAFLERKHEGVSVSSPLAYEYRIRHEDD